MSKFRTAGGRGVNIQSANFNNPDWTSRDYIKAISLVRSLVSHASKRAPSIACKNFSVSVCIILIMEFSQNDKHNSQVRLDKE